MARNPNIVDKEFFDMLDEIQLVRKESNEGYPWTHATEDRQAAESCVASLYEAHKLPPPRAYSWARSPRAMWGAIQLLRQFQTESRYKVVEGLVPLGDPVETEAKRVMLDVALDRTITTTLGANLSRIFTMQHSTMRRSLVDLKEILGEQMIPPQNRMPSFSDMTLWPIESLPSNFYNLKGQAIVIAPFMHCCFLSRPPKWIKTNEQGRLHSTDGPAVLFEDGYAAWVAQTPQHRLDDGDDAEYLPEPEVLALPAPEEK
jgi:hypothetical protein